MTKVFVHGNPETAAIWNLLIEELGKMGTTDVALLSPPGFGAPLPDGWVPTIANYRNWLISELESLGGKVDLVGHDWGAGHVFSLLAHRSDLVRSWVTDCIGLLHPLYQWHDAAQGWQTPDVGEAMVETMVAMPDDDFVQAFSSLGMTPDIARAVKSSITSDMGRCILGLYRDAAQPAMSQLGSTLVAQHLPRGAVVIADQDHYAGTVSMMEEMATSLQADVVRMPGCGHWWMIEQPERAAEALIAHWSQQ